MAGREPTAELDARYGDADMPTSWADALRRFQQAQVYWVVTVRTEGGPHVTPLFGVRLDGALYFFTGPTEQKARNLAGQPALRPSDRLQHDRRARRRGRGRGR